MLTTWVDFLFFFIMLCVYLTGIALTFVTPLLGWSQLLVGLILILWYTTHNLWTQNDKPIQK
jgi:hypothetical protein